MAYFKLVNNIPLNITGVIIHDLNRLSGMGTGSPVATIGEESTFPGVDDGAQG